MATLGGTSLGLVQNEEVTKAADLDIQPAAGLDSNSTFVFDYVGARREITISGRITRDQGESDAVFLAKLTTLENKINGAQIGTIAYVSDIRGTINVYIDNMRSGFREASPNIFEYTIVLIEGV